MEYQFDYAKFCKTFNVNDDKAIDSLRLTHTQDINFKLFPYKASGKAQAPIITELEVVVTDMTHEEALTKYWGEQAFSSMLGDDEDIDNSLMYAVYNDEIDDYFQLGTLTEILNEENECIAIKVYREVIF